MNNIESFNHEENKQIQKIDSDHIKKGNHIVLVEENNNSIKRTVIDVKKNKKGNIVGEITGDALGSNEIKKVIVPCNTKEGQWDLSANFLGYKYFLEPFKEMELIIIDPKSSSKEALKIKPTSIEIDTTNRDLNDLENYANS